MGCIRTTRVIGALPNQAIVRIEAFGWASVVITIRIGPTAKLNQGIPVFVYKADDFGLLTGTHVVSGDDRPNSQHPK